MLKTMNFNSAAYTRSPTTFPVILAHVLLDEAAARRENKVCDHKVAATRYASAVMETRKPH